MEAGSSSARFPLPAATAWSAASPGGGPGSARSARSCAVRVRPSSMPRQDTIPCPHTGRRMVGAVNRQIRVFLRLPCKGRLALWVYPELPVGPAPARARDRFAQCWGEDAESRGPFGRRPAPEGAGRLTPVRGLLAKRQHEESGNFGAEGLAPFGGTESTATFGGAATTAAFGKGGPAARGMETKGAFRVEGLQDSTFMSSWMCDSSWMSSEGPGSPDYDGPASLKGLVEQATGVPVARQKIVFGGKGPLDNHNYALCDYGIGHGAFLYLSVRPEGGAKRSLPFLACTAKADSHEPGFILERIGDFLKSRSGSRKGREIVECMPDWRQAKPPPLEVEWPHEQIYFDYQWMPDNSIFDLTGRVRKRFAQHERAAKSAACARAHRSSLDLPQTAR